MAYVDTDTCSYCHGGAYADTDRDCANTDPCANSYGDTNADSHCYTNAGSANTTAWIDGYAHACPYSYSRSDTDADTHPDTKSDTNANTDPGTYHSFQ